jgi:hypothetical protein
MGGGEGRGMQGKGGGMRERERCVCTRASRGGGGGTPGRSAAWSSIGAVRVRRACVRAQAPGCSGASRPPHPQRPAQDKHLPLREALRAGAWMQWGRCGRGRGTRRSVAPLGQAMCAGTWMQCSITALNSASVSRRPRTPPPPSQARPPPPPSPRVVSTAPLAASSAASAAERAGALSAGWPPVMRWASWQRVRHSSSVRFSTPSRRTPAATCPPRVTRRPKPHKPAAGGGRAPRGAGAAARPDFDARTAGRRAGPGRLRG